MTWRWDPTGVLTTKQAPLVAHIHAGNRPWAELAPAVRPSSQLWPGRRLQSRYALETFRPGIRHLLINRKNLCSWLRKSDCRRVPTSISIWARLVHQHWWNTNDRLGTVLELQIWQCILWEDDNYEIQMKINYVFIGQNVWILAHIFKTFFTVKKMHSLKFTFLQWQVQHFPISVVCQAGSRQANGMLITLFQCVFKFLSRQWGVCLQPHCGSPPAHITVE